MLTYIIRRLLYSIVVLILASFLVFSFVIKGAGDPLARSWDHAERLQGDGRRGSSRRSTSTTRSRCGTGTG